MRRSRQEDPEVADDPNLGFSLHPISLFVFIYTYTRVHRAPRKWPDLWVQGEAILNSRWSPHLPTRFQDTPVTARLGILTDVTFQSQSRKGGKQKSREGVRVAESHTASSGT